MAGGVHTESVAALESTAVPQVLVLDTRQRYFQPFWFDATEVIIYVGFVSPVMSCHAVPAVLLSCHWNCSEGLPLAATVNVSGLPATAF